MLIPLRTDSPLRHTPYVNWALIAANVLVFLYTQRYPDVTTTYELSARHPQLLQFLTYQFLHAGWLHLIGNMLFLYIFGNNVSDRLGHLGYAALYIAGGIFAGISYLLTTNVDSGLVGASGSIATVTGAYLILLPRSNVTIVYFYILVGVAEVASLWFILGFFAYDIFLNFSARDSVAHTAHIGGTIFGALMCIVLLATRLLPRDPFDALAMIQRWNRRRQYRDMVAGGYNPFEYTQPSRLNPFSRQREPAPPDPRTSRILQLRGDIADELAATNLDQATRHYSELKMLDIQQVLPRQQQLDVANHLAHQSLYPQAAEAYETYLKAYPKTEQTGQVELMLGLIYARYIPQTDRARDYLTRAASKYHDGREYDMARAELARLGPMAPPAT